MKKFLSVIIALVIVGVAALWLFSSETQIKVDPPVSVIGVNTPVTVHLENPHGIREFTATLEQDGSRYKIYEVKNPARRFFVRRHEPSRSITFLAGKNRAPRLHEGKARLVMEAKSNDFRASTQTFALDVNVVTQPPRLVVDGYQHYINQGGSELVTFTVSGFWTEAGVRVGQHTFRSFPLPGKPKNERFSLFAFPWNESLDTVPVVYARNSAGTEVRGHFWFKIFPKKYRSRDLQLSDAFLQKVTEQIDPTGTGDLLSRFLRINGQMRVDNNRTLADLRLKTEPRMLWDGAFLQLSNSAVESQFADVRSYIYKGKKVDQQVHLGFDLASTLHAPVLASNSGRVVWASDLGIYGNCIVIDHGYGLQSIYGHLANFEVKVGDMVKKGQEIGRSDSTGLAGGDHLHFSMQVDGVQVNPIEWWDAHWLHDRVMSKLAPSER